MKTKPLKWITTPEKKKKNQAIKKKSTEVAILFLFLTQFKKKKG